MSLVNIDSLNDINHCDTTNSIQNLFFQPISPELSLSGFSVSQIMDCMTCREYTPSKMLYVNEEIIQLHFLLKLNIDRTLERNLQDLKKTLEIGRYQIKIEEIYCNFYQIIAISVKSTQRKKIPSLMMIQEGPIPNRKGEVSLLCQKYSSEEYPQSLLLNRFVHLSNKTSIYYIARIAKTILSCKAVKEYYIMKNFNKQQLMEVATNKTDKWTKERTKLKEEERIKRLIQPSKIDAEIEEYAHSFTTTLEKSCFYCNESL